MKIHKVILQGTAGDRGRLEGFCQRLTPTEYAAGARLRALAVELAKWEELEVSAVAYEDESLELEVIFHLDPFREPVTIDQDKTGARCQVSWQRWADIGDEAATGKTAQMIIALAVAVSCTPSTQPSSGVQVRRVPGSGGCPAGSGSVSGQVIALEGVTTRSPGQ